MTEVEIKFIVLMELVLKFHKNKSKNIETLRIEELFDEGYDFG